VQDESTMENSINPSLKLELTKQRVNKFNVGSSGIKRKICGEAAKGNQLYFFRHLSR
jgi:hypothetical protein